MVFRDPYRFKKRTELFIAAEGIHTGQFVYCGKKGKRRASMGGRGSHEGGAPGRSVGEVSRKKPHRVIPAVLWPFGDVVRRVDLRCLWPAVVKNTSRPGVAQVEYRPMNQVSVWFLVGALAGL